MILHTDNSEFRTTETPLAAYLIQEGFTLLIIEYEELPNGKRRATFVFENDTTKLKELVSAYNRGDVTINLVMYEHAKSALLDRIMRGLP
jgi:hypothetical protein